MAAGRPEKAMMGNIFTNPWWKLEERGTRGIDIFLLSQLFTLYIMLLD